ncbi:DUF4145 domain-containing protein [Exercitatus varius]|uniref:DUF4145 domain-containing protein n=1 Tax=Exercitatus varius TaxID=67857 RepID=UPI0018A5EF3C|nr:DUF4145 domain-containing protein [Exercitatus varius]MDG2942919.1 DUF4145 domain-containing protein [Exercitatus varius]QOF68339.1 DUF4145 domain-containing protein [Actinobacillus sp. GY-402]
MENYTNPKFKRESFHCPNCGTYSHMHWNRLINGSSWTEYYQCICSCCKKNSLWRANKVDHLNNHYDGEMIYPDFGLAPLPETDMPEDVKADYMEASRIFSRSKRGAAALLRLALQKLCKHLEQKGDNINDDIRSLAKNHVLPKQVIQVADTLRITGNNAVHPGTMSDDDFDDVAGKMFDLLNFIVRKGISEPKQLNELYLKMPENARKAAENADIRNANK